MRSHTFYGGFGTGVHSFPWCRMYGHALCRMGGTEFILPAPILFSLPRVLDWIDNLLISVRSTGLAAVEGYGICCVAMPAPAWSLIDTVGFAS